MKPLTSPAKHSSWTAGRCSPKAKPEVERPSCPNSPLTHHANSGECRRWPHRQPSSTETCDLMVDDQEVSQGAQRGCPSPPTSKATKGRPVPDCYSCPTGQFDGTISGRDRESAVRAYRSR